MRQQQLLLEKSKEKLFVVFYPTLFLLVIQECRRFPSAPLEFSVVPSPVHFLR